MLNSINIKNFKSLNFSEKLSFKPLTLFCGANSSGKSSILQAILLASQTANSQFSGSNMLLNGKYTKLGGFDDIVKNGKCDDLIEFELDIKETRSSYITRMIIKFEFGLDSNDDKIDKITPPIKSIIYHIFTKNNEKIYISLISTKEGGVFEIKDSSDISTFLNDDYIKDKTVKDIHLDGIKPAKATIQYNETRDNIYSLLNFMTDIKITNFSEGSHRQQSLFYNEDNDFINKNLIRLIIDFSKKHSDKIKRKIEKDLSSNIDDIFGRIESRPGFTKENLARLILDNAPVLNEEMFDTIRNADISKGKWASFMKGVGKEKRKILINFINRNRDDIIEEYLKNIDNEYKEESYLPKIFFYISSFINMNLSNDVKYIGPLRSKPKSVYPLSDISNVRDIGVEGENSAAILHINRNQIIDFPIINDENELVVNSSKDCFLSALHYWLNYLDIVKSVETSAQGKFGYELKVSVEDGNEVQDLNHVGVGVSQVIPIVMQCLLSDKNDILIFEQPELHLHPKIQCKLCDLFIAMSIFDRQIIIETHSEYLINRLRYRIAQSIETNIKDYIAINFTSKYDGVTKVDNIEISPFGAIKNWPKDFFDQTQIEVENILISANKKRKLLKGSKL